LILIVHLSLSSVDSSQHSYASILFFLSQMQINKNSCKEKDKVVTGNSDHTVSFAETERKNIVYIIDVQTGWKKIYTNQDVVLQ
jgi:hypothetical protein